MKKYKLFNEGLRSTFGNYVATVGLNKAENEYMGLCYADGKKIMDYYLDHGILITQVVPKNKDDERPATIPEKIGEYDAPEIYISEPEIVFNKKVLKNLDQQNGLNNLNRTGFIKDLIYYENKEIDCGYRRNGEHNIKSFNGYESFDYLMFDKKWIESVDLEEICRYCTEIGKIDFLKYINEKVNNIDLTETVIEGLKQNNLDVVNYVVESEKHYSPISVALNPVSNIYDKLRMSLQVLKHPIKSYKEIEYNKETEYYRHVPERRDYDIRR